MARKKATPLEARKKAPRSRKPKTSSAPGEAAKAHEWLMTEAESEEPKPGPFGDAAWLEAERIKKLSPRKKKEGYVKPHEIELEPAAPPPSPPEEPHPSDDPPPPPVDLGRDPVTGRWIKGFKQGPGLAGPGRPKGSRNKLGEAFIQALQADFEIYGAVAIQEVRRNRPHEYLKVVAGTLPKELIVSKNPIEELDDDELLAIITAAREAERVSAESGSGMDEAPIGKPAGVLLS